MWTRALLKKNGKELFLRNYWPCVGMSFVLGLVTGGVGSVSGQIGSRLTMNNFQSGLGMNNHSLDRYSGRTSYIPPRILLTIMIIYCIVMLVSMAYGIFVGSVLSVGGCSYFIKNRTMEGRFGDLVSGFTSGHYWNIVKTMFLMQLYIALWSLLFIIPGLIKAYEYLMVPFILAENPGMETKDVLAISKRMMTGQKWEAFVLHLSFIGWELLAVGLTCGLLMIFFVTPYMAATNTELYAYNKVQAYNEGYIR